MITLTSELRHDIDCRERITTEFSTNCCSHLSIWDWRPLNKEKPYHQPQLHTPPGKKKKWLTHGNAYFPHGGSAALFFFFLNEELFLKYLQVPCVCFTRFVNMNLMDIWDPQFHSVTQTRCFSISWPQFHIQHTADWEGKRICPSLQAFKTLHNTIPYLLKARTAL